MDRIKFHDRHHTHNFWGDFNQVAFSGARKICLHAETLGLISAYDDPPLTVQLVASNHKSKQNMLSSMFMFL